MRNPVDFAKQSAPSPRAGWALALVGLLALGGALWTRHEREVRIALQESLNQQVRDQERRLKVSAVPKKSTPRQLRLETAQKELADPTLRLLRAIESVTREPIAVYLRSVVVEHATRTVTVEGEAPSFDYALGYVQVLDEDDLLEPALMLSHEPIVDAYGNPAVTFSARTRWRAQ